MFCIMSNLWNQVDDNYKEASKRYQKKKEAILQQLQQNSNGHAKEFISLIEQNYKIYMNQLYTSDLTKRDVKLETITKHLYKAASKTVQGVLNNEDINIEEQIEALRKFSQENGYSIEQEKKFMVKELDKIVEKYSQETNINELVNRILPEYVSTENQKLSAAQIYSYTKSIMKKEIYKRAAITEIQKVLKQHPSIILGYIREDAITQAISSAIEEFKLIGMSAKTVGSQGSKIDIIVSLTENTSTSMGDDDALESIIKKLDGLESNFTTTGVSKYDSSEFLGIQSKPWDLNKETTAWNKNSVGSRGSLLHEFQLENITGLPNDSIGWHRGVLFLSQRLEEVIGPNVDMYAVKDSILWTSDLLNDLVNVYHKYFAFMVNSKGKLLSHIQLADHYG